MEDKEIILKDMGRRFRHYRELNGYTRTYAAERLGVTSRTLASYERGEREISVKTTIRMAEIYGTTFARLTNYRNRPELCL